MHRIAAITVGTLAPLILAAATAAAQGVPVGTPVPSQPLGQAAGDLLGEERSVVSFGASQLAFPRVADARLATDLRLHDRFDQAGLTYPAREIFIRVFKHERILQLWARSRTDADFTLVHEYTVCALPGQLGPKRRMGDVQVPEGFYYIDHFNPRSAYHLSLRVNYPNVADRMRGHVIALGGDIFVHGGCETAGCIPIENENIEEIYWLAVQAVDAGQAVIPVHVFPARLDPDRLAWLADTFDPEPDLLAFWRNLAEGYAYFEATRRVPWITVAESGRYAVPAAPPAPVAPDVAADTASDAASDAATATAAGSSGSGGS